MEQSTPLPPPEDDPAAPAADVTAFMEHRPRLFSLAYRMFGAASEAEDVVQEVYLRWALADHAEIANIEAWLTTVTVNLCRTQLVSARARRETYVGQWLPEPVPTGGGALGPLGTVEERESVSLAVLTAMERLSPIERAVFVLREAFGYSHAEIAEMLDLTVANTQQIFHRAGQRVRTGKQRFVVSAEHARTMIEKFLQAASTGDVDGLRELLADDVVSVADGGGRVVAAKIPVVGGDVVARYLSKLRRFLGPTARFEFAEINGDVGLILIQDEIATGVLVFDFDEAGSIAAVRTVVNPIKLGAVTV
ncbi:RNA polymerase ECF family sigma subunit [Nocardia fluminea]|uniref:RNA polymerase ECF family sigma subunit n=2 Tax=Nocardia fluminea TaxID=134984 RepID=A0A2N3VBU4_9NOCA|nr:RNA polymerase sigma-70 factor [Nocardia fluminea]PKV79104.1 RNA polymerase ECF family sigma subunit [Nocardia fluminea]